MWLPALTVLTVPGWWSSRDHVPAHDADGSDRELRGDMGCPACGQQAGVVFPDPQPRHAFHPDLPARRPGHLRGRPGGLGHGEQFVLRQGHLPEQHGAVGNPGRGRRDRARWRGGRPAGSAVVGQADRPKRRGTGRGHLGSPDDDHPVHPGADRDSERGREHRADRRADRDHDERLQLHRRTGRPRRGRGDHRGSGVLPHGLLGPPARPSCWTAPTSPPS